MFFANLNVFTLLFACAFYLALWLPDTTASVLLVPRSGMAAMTLAGCAGVALLLTAIWVRKGMAPSAPGKLYWAGQALVAIANVALAGGMRLSLHAASISKEEEVWFTMVMLYYLGPSAVVLAAVGLVMAIVAAEKRQGRR
ncbi:hypothetical protein [Massilia aquatica]|uniref:Uncharacterized protein n=1 Tax=Massilia aquatica TaxID=2609000 RepID=A0ABX0MDM4_9BURK|nr:hypothetical protein [Massilia aquatica]NHZ40236.1 hypothetical protein [Massilia aquatica]